MGRKRRDDSKKRRRSRIKRLRTEDLLEGLELDLLNAAKLRQVRWGNTIRAIVMRGAPNPNYYSESVFNKVTSRPDFDRVHELMQNRALFDEAVETDAWIRAFSEHKPERLEACAIRYVEREPGGRILTKEEQLIRFKNRTGCGGYGYYARLREVTDEIILRIVAKERT